MGTLCHEWPQRLWTSWLEQVDWSWSVVFGLFQDTLELCLLIQVSSRRLIFRLWVLRGAMCTTGGHLPFNHLRNVALQHLFLQNFLHSPWKAIVVVQVLNMIVTVWMCAYQLTQNREGILGVCSNPNPDILGICLIVRVRVIF